MRDKIIILEILFVCRVPGFGYILTIGIKFRSLETKEPYWTNDSWIGRCLAL